MMLELVKLLVFAVLCSPTQGSLVQVTAECFNAVFWCTGEMGFLIWDIRTRTGSSQSFTFQSVSHVGTTETRALNSSQVIGNVTFNNGPFINATVTVTRPINLNGSTIRCNQDFLTLNIPTRSSITPPTALNVSHKENTSMIDIHWNSDGNGYCIQYSAHPRANGNWNHVTNASYTILLMNTTYKITIALHHEMNVTSNFTIGSCLSYDDLIMERKYILELNGTWTVFQECTNSRIQFDTRCGSNGSWTTDMRCPETTTGVYTSNISTSSMPTMGTTSVIMTTVQRENFSETKLISSLIPIIGVITIAVITATFTYLVIIRKKRKKSSIQYQAQTETSEMTYQCLSNKHHGQKPNTSSRQIHTANTEIRDQGEYSSLHHKKPFLPSNEEYDTVPNIHQPETSKDLLQYGSLETKNTTSVPETSNGYRSTSHPAHAMTKKLKYTDVDMSGHNGPMGLDLIRIKVDYADINLRARPEDETLNLDSLLIQLNPMSKDFRLFGSVAGISPDTLDKIVASSAAPYDGLVEVCDAWLDKCRKEKTTPTWSAVADILSLIGRDKLSHGIMQVYTTGKLPIEVDMNALDVQGEVCLPSPPPLPPHREEGNEDTCSEVELMTVTSVMTSRQLPASRDTAMEAPPPIPEKLHDIMPAGENDEPHQALPELPHKLPVKEQQRKPVPARRKQSKDDEVVPSLPPRPPKNTL